MTRIEIEKSLNELNSMVLNGKAMEAFEKYYHDEVSMQENYLAPTISKAANRDREIQFYQDITEFHTAEIKGMAVGDGTSYVSWRYDYTHRNWGVRIITRFQSSNGRKEKLFINNSFIQINNITV